MKNYELLARAFLKRVVSNQLFRVMKVTAFLLLIGCLHLSAASWSQTVTLNAKGQSLKQVFEAVEKQTGYWVVYSDQLINRSKPITINAEEMALTRFLEQILKPQSLTYTIEGKNILVMSSIDHVPTRSGKRTQLGNAVSIPVQQRIIRGKVTDEAGNSLQSVTVTEKNTQNVVFTNAQGNYEIETKGGNIALVFTIVGYASNEQVVGNRSTIDVVLNESMSDLDEVVVVGYGTQKKSDLTGSVAVVSSEHIGKRNSLQLAQALQGATPGVTVSRSSGGVGDPAAIRIRGITTIGDSNPLVLIDGVPGSINDVHPNDVESLSVLKDGASAAIYGARAASGVILITTKRAKEGVKKLTYSHDNGFESPTRIPDYLGVTDYMRMMNEMNWNDNDNLGTESPRFSADLIADYPRLHAEDPERYPDTKWASYLKDYARRQSHNLSFTAGQENVSSLISLAYDKFGTLTDGRNFTRINARANNNVEINKAVSLRFNVQYLNTDDEREPGFVPSINLLSNLEPNAIAFYSDGRIATVRNGDNHWAQMLRGGTSSQQSNLIRGQIGIDVTPIEGLKLTGMYAPTFGFNKHKQHIKQLRMTSIDDPNVTTGFVNGRTNTSLSEVRGESKEFNTQFLANYSKALGDHAFELLAGYESNYAFNENISAARSQYTLHTYPYLNLGPLDYRDNSGSAYEYASRSYFGRLMYNYNGKYLVQMNVRKDGSSRFHRNHRWGTFPSASLGWVLSEETFFNTSELISFLKLRGSWGALGNERIGNYPYQPTISFADALFHQGNNVVSNQTAYVGKYAIEDISWESTSSINLGVDMNLLNNRLSVTADYFTKVTSNMLLALAIPDFIGLDNPDQNTGKMKTKGWEIDLRYRDEIGEFKYSVSANLSDYRSIMGDLGGTQFLGNQVKFEGSEFDEWYGYKSAGIYQTQEEVDNSATINNRIKPGDIKYVDISGPDGVPDGIISGTYDRVLLGGSLPRFEYGGNISVSYYGFDLSVILQGVGKRNSHLNNIMVQPLRGGGLAAPAIVGDNYWSNYNTPAENLNVRYPRLSEVGAVGNNYVMSDHWLIDGSYLRVKNLVLGYNVPESITKRIGTNNVRLNCNFIDFFSFDKFPKGIDPELSSAGYFIMKSVVFGLSLSI